MLCAGNDGQDREQAFVASAFLRGHLGSGNPLHDVRLLEPEPQDQTAVHIHIISGVGSLQSVLGRGKARELQRYVPHGNKETIIVSLHLHRVSNVFAALPHVFVVKHSPSTL